MLIVATFFISCSSEEEECPDTNLPYLRLSLEQKSNLKIDTLLIFHDNLADDLYEGSAVTDCVMIPLNLNADSTILNFKFTLIADSLKRYTDTILTPFLHLFVDSILEITDEVKFIHSNKIKVNDLECGFITEFELHSIYYTSQFIDSIYIYDTLINSAEKNHVTIFY